MSSNFDPLLAEWPAIAACGQHAETCFSSDPRGAMFHLRRFGEVMATYLCHFHRLHPSDNKQSTRLRLLKRVLDRCAIDPLYTLKDVGNRGVHKEPITRYKLPMRMLRAAHALTAWFWEHHTSARSPKPVPFIKPRSSQPTEQLRIDRADRTSATAQAASATLMLVYREVSKQIEEAPSPMLLALLKKVGPFRRSPFDPKWPLRRPRQSVDERLRLFDVEENAVVFLLEPDDALIAMLFIGAREEAERWAAHHAVTVNAISGVVQVVPQLLITRTTPGMLFAATSDEQLIQLGIPSALIPSLRPLNTINEFEELSPLFPSDCRDPLTFLSLGFDANELIAEQQPPASHDLAVAVHHASSRESFAIVDEDLPLESLFSGELAQWRIFLHPQQRQLITTQAEGPVQVLGGAGTGKTVALLHRTLFLLEHAFPDPDSRGLVTTFTRTLAAELSDQLDRLLPADLRDRVHVEHLHGLGTTLWERHERPAKFAYPTSVSRAWEVAFTDLLPDTFLISEWRRAMGVLNLQSVEQYLNSEPTDHWRSLWRTLSAQQKRHAWDRLMLFRATLNSEGRLAAEDYLNTLTKRLNERPKQRPFEFALCDELQDLDEPALRLLRALVPTGPNDLFLVGDPNQRIYGREPSLNHCGITLNDRSYHLHVNYRTTAQVRRWAVRALEHRPDAFTHSLNQDRSVRSGAAPEVHTFLNANAEMARILSTLTAWRSEVSDKTLCVAAHSNRLLTALEAALNQAGLPTLRLSPNTRDKGEGIRLATFHRLKGLEFGRVLLAHVQAKTLPKRGPHFNALQPAQQREWDTHQANLIYTAATRARDLLVITGHGEPSPFTINLL